MLPTEAWLPEASPQAREGDHKLLSLCTCVFFLQVNAGPMAYARAFLEESNAKRYPDNQVKLLKEIFR